MCVLQKAVCKPEPASYSLVTPAAACHHRPRAFPHSSWSIFIMSLNVHHPKARQVNHISTANKLSTHYPSLLSHLCNLPTPFLPHQTLFSPPVPLNTPLSHPPTTHHTPLHWNTPPPPPLRPSRACLFLPSTPVLGVGHVLQNVESSLSMA